MTLPNNFAIYYAGDAYSTANKIIGRQSTGKAFIRGLARTWPQAALHGVGHGMPAANAMAAQLQADGFTGRVRWSEAPNWAALAEVGCLYFPSPSTKEIVASRNMYN